jgi:hypothetical protein
MCEAAPLLCVVVLKHGDSFKFLHRVCDYINSVLNITKYFAIQMYCICTCKLRIGETPAAVCLDYFPQSNVGEVAVPARRALLFILLQWIVVVVIVVIIIIIIIIIVVVVVVVMQYGYRASK